MRPDTPPHTPAEEKEIRIADLVLFKALWPFIRPYAWMLLTVTLMVFLVTFLELLMPIFTQKAFDGFIVPVTPGAGIRIFGIAIPSFKTFSLLFAGFIIVSFVVDFFQTLFMEYTGQKIILNLRCALFEHMTLLPVAFYDKNASGRLVSRVAGDIENMNEMFTSVLVFIFKDLALMAGIMAVLFSIDLKLGFYLSLLIPVILVSTGFFSRISRNAFRTIRQKIGEINHSFSEAVSGIRIIQTTGSRDTFVRRFEDLNFRHYTAALFQIRIFSVFMPFVGFLGVLSTAIILWTGSFQVTDKVLTLGELVAFLSYMKLFFRPLRELSEKFSLLQNALASAERIIGILETGRAKERLQTNRQRIDTISHISFDRIGFSYDKKTPVLKDISFELEKGQSIGIVGHTGSGKSSIINLITGFYRPDTGQIRFNGIPGDAINIRDLRSRTALVMQDPVLFSGSIRENIAPDGYGMSEADMKAALLNANCDFLYEKFNGPDTDIQEGGRPLSSGEKQLVCIARAFAFDPDLIIFDEATSYMDSASEQTVHDAMKKLMKGRLSIIIAHRLSTVRDCDTILLIRDGVIREKGSHEALAESRGEYYHLLEKETI